MNLSVRINPHKIFLESGNPHPYECRIPTTFQASYHLLKSNLQKQQNFNLAIFEKAEPEGKLQFLADFEEENC